MSNLKIRLTGAFLTLGTIAVALATVSPSGHWDGI